MWDCQGGHYLIVIECPPLKTSCSPLNVYLPSNQLRKSHEGIKNKDISLIQNFYSHQEFSNGGRSITPVSCVWSTGDSDLLYFWAYSIKSVGKMDGPSITLASLSEILAFAVGSFIPMPACRVFSMIAALAVFSHGPPLLQMINPSDGSKHT